MAERKTSTPKKSKRKERSIIDSGLDLSSIDTQGSRRMSLGLGEELLPEKVDRLWTDSDDTSFIQIFPERKASSSVVSQDSVDLSVLHTSCLLEIVDVLREETEQWQAYKWKEIFRMLGGLGNQDFDFFFDRIVEDKQLKKTDRSRVKEAWDETSGDLKYKNLLWQALLQHNETIAISVKEQLDELDKDDIRQEAWWDGFNQLYNLSGEYIPSEFRIASYLTKLFKRTVQPVQNTIHFFGKRGLWEEISKNELCVQITGALDKTIEDFRGHPMALRTAQVEAGKYSMKQKMLFTQMKQKVGRVLEQLASKYRVVKHTVGLRTLILGQLEADARENRFEKQLNAQIDILPCENGEAWIPGNEKPPAETVSVPPVQDFYLTIPNEQIVKLTPEDCFTISSNLNLRLTISPEIFARCEKIIDEITCYDKEVKQVLCSLLLKTIKGGNSGELFVFIRGDTRAGKGLLYHIMECILGPFYVGSNGVKLFIKQPGKIDNDINTGLMRTKDARMLAMDELNPEDEIDEKKIKGYSGLSTQEGRNPHGKHGAFVAKAIVWFISNYVFRCSPDPAVVIRLWYLHLGACFALPGEEVEGKDYTLPETEEERIAKKMFLKDDNLKQEISSNPEMILGFFQVIVKNALWDLKVKPEWAIPFFLTEQLNPMVEFKNWIKRRFVKDWTVLNPEGKKIREIIELFHKEYPRLKDKIETPNLVSFLQENYQRERDPKDPRRLLLYKQGKDDRRLRFRIINDVESPGPET